MGRVGWESRALVLLSGRGGGNLCARIGVEEVGTADGFEAADGFRAFVTLGQSGCSQGKVWRRRHAASGEESIWFCAELQRVGSSRCGGLQPSLQCCGKGRFFSSGGEDYSARPGTRSNAGAGGNAHALAASPDVLFDRSVVPAAAALAIPGYGEAPAVYLR